jgi:hypothetical protein
MYYPATKAYYVYNTVAEAKQNHPNMVCVEYSEEYTETLPNGKLGVYLGNTGTGTSVFISQ